MDLCIWAGGQWHPAIITSYSGGQGVYSCPSLAATGDLREIPGRFPPPVGVNAWKSIGDDRLIFNTAAYYGKRLPYVRYGDPAFDVAAGEVRVIWRYTGSSLSVAGYCRVEAL